MMSKILDHRKNLAESVLKAADYLRKEGVILPDDVAAFVERLEFAKHMETSGPRIIYSEERDMFRRMALFEQETKNSSGLRELKIWPGHGTWDGKDEATWVVSYKGNGETSELITKIGLRYNQRAVLFLYAKSAKRGKLAAVYDFDFHSVSPLQRAIVGKLLATYGIKGWLWFRRNDRAVLRIVSIGGRNSLKFKELAIAAKELERDLFAFDASIKVSCEMIRAEEITFAEQVLENGPR